MSDDTPDLTDRQREYLDALPADSLREWGDAVGISKTGIESAKDRLNKKSGIDIQYVGDEWRQIESTPTAERVGSDPEIQDTSAPSAEHAADDEGETPDDPEITKRLINDLKQGGLTFDEFETRHGHSPSVAKRILRDLRESGRPVEFDVVDDAGTRLWYISQERDKRFKVGNGDGHYRFGLISDTHLGSTAEHLNDLNDFYDELVDRGIDIVFHAGDISDGWEVHKNHINHVVPEASGWNRLEDYVVENYPSRPSVDTFYISGNHDHKLYRRTGIRFGQLIANRRDDLHWCGDSQARFIFDPEHDIDLELLHPSGGKPYSVGYRLQTLFRERPLTSRPTIAGVGHLHGSMFAEAEGVKGFYTGCWKGLTTYGKRKGHATSIGGWIVDLQIRDGVIRRLTPQWVGYEARDTTNEFSMTDIDEMRD